MDNKARGAMEMTAAMLISGTIGWLVMASAQPVVDVVFWRCAFAAPTLALICAVRGLFRSSRPSSMQLALAGLGGVAIVGNWLLLFAAYPRASISIATAVYHTQPFMLVGLGAIFFAEKLSAAKMTWLGIAFGGMLCIVESASTPNSAGTHYLAGIGLALAAAFLYAVAAVIAKHLRGVAPHLIALVQVSVGVVLLAPFAHRHSLPTAPGTWTLLVTLGVVHTGLMYILLYGAIQKLPTSLTGALSFIYPIVAIVVDYAAFGHRLQGSQIAGATAILVAAAGMTLGWSPFKPLRLLKRRRALPVQRAAQDKPCDDAAA